MSEIIKERRGVRLVQSADGRFAVIADGDVLVETKVLSYAEMEFDEAVEARDSAKQRRHRERAFYDMQAVRSDSFERRATNARKTGGKGGRGGV
ncbi:hypothetical protein [Mycobacterium avium]|uniref:hypothetical protein n=1 Tax=Mycobacterium avium TaxID=1764 RepID=UPI0007A0B02C|nr:hypothetical protein [Mycobacterium avium]MDV3215243.1 hypothetical protein [Mycobacterium avium]